MKKLIVVALSAIMVLSLAAASMAAINLSGEIKTGYEWVPAPGADYNKFTLKANSKVSDTVTAYGKFEDKNQGGLKVDEAYFVVNSGFADFTFGDFDYNITGVNGEAELELLADDTTLQTDEFENQFAVMGSVNGLPKGMFAKAGYMREGADYWVTLGYAAEKWGAAYNYLNDGKMDGTEKAAWTANAFFKPVENVTVYGHFSDQEDNDNETAIVGVNAELGNFFGYYEYNTQDRNDENAYGYEVGYNFSNKVAASYEYASIQGADADQALYLKVKFQ